MSPDVEHVPKPDNGVDKKWNKVHGYEEGKLRLMTPVCVFVCIRMCMCVCTRVRGLFVHRQTEILTYVCIHR